MSDQRVRIKDTWDKAGSEGVVLAGPVRDLKGQDWMVVLWDGEEDPALHKAAGLLVREEVWRVVAEATRVQPPPVRCPPHELGAKEGGWRRRCVKCGVEVDR
jgi:hypothetical protein